MIEQVLISEYEKLYDELPSNFEAKWFKQKPAVPFVGEQYGKGQRPKVLVYGSAENLTHLWDKRTGKPKEVTLSPKRNRHMYEDWVRERQEKGADQVKFFPDVHMTPVSDGSLLTAARYLLAVFGKPDFSTSPGEFIQQIAVGNYGKYSRAGERSEDPARHPDWLEMYWPYIQKDLKELAPDIVILPRSIFRNGLSRKRKEWPHVPNHIWTIYQTNQRVATLIKRQLAGAGLKEPKSREGWVGEWLSHVPGRIRMDRYLDWIDWQKGKGDIERGNP